ASSRSTGAALTSSSTTARSMWTATAPATRASAWSATSARETGGGRPNKSAPSDPRLDRDTDGPGRSKALLSGPSCSAAVASDEHPAGAAQRLHLGRASQPHRDGVRAQHPVDPLG